MKNTLLVFRKEARAYFNSPVAYIVLAVFLLISGHFFSSPLFLINEATISHFLDVAPILLVFFIPAITMRLVAEELKTGTFEILATLPIKDWEILLGKYLASLLLLTCAILLTLSYPFIVGLLAPLDWGQIAGSYLGIFLMGAALVATGLFSSTLSKNQIVAFIFSFLICFAFFLLGKSTAFLPPPLARLVDFLGLDSHLNNISKGLIDSRDLVYFGSLIALFLFLSFLNLSARKWK